MHDLLLLFAARNIYDVGMAQSDPFEGLGAALIRLRERAGFSRQTEASEALKIDKGQLSRWENENPRPTLENLGRLLAGYGATVGDLAAALGAAAGPPRGGGGRGARGWGGGGAGGGGGWWDRRWGRRKARRRGRVWEGGARRRGCLRMR